MNFRATSTIVLATSLIALIGCVREATFESPNFNFATPDGWEKVSPEKGYEIYKSDFWPDLLVAGPKTDGFISNINLTITPSEASLEQLARSSKDALEVTIDAKFQADIDELTVDGDKALSATFVVGKTKLKQKQVYFVHEGREYVLTYAASPKAYEQDLDALNQVVESWKWK